MDADRERIIKNVSAVGFWEHVREYDWTVAKSLDADPTQLMVVPPGQTTDAGFTIDYERSLGSEMDVYGVRGAVKLENVSDLVVGAKIMGTVHTVYGGCNVSECYTFEVNTTCPTVPSCEDPSFPYEFMMVPVEGASYQVQFMVLNCADGQDDPTCYSWPEFRDFSLPNEPTDVEVDAEAVLTDEVLPSEFETAIDDAGPWYLSDPGSQQIAVTMTNQGVRSERPLAVVDQAKLVENDTKQVRRSDATVCIDTRQPGAPPIECPPETVFAHLTYDVSRDRTVEHDWALTKEASVSEITAGRSLTYWINATRTDGAVETIMTVNGKVAVTNTGDCPIAISAIELLVENGEGLPGTTIDPREKPVLAPGETHSYRFTITGPDSGEDQISIAPRMVFQDRTGERSIEGLNISRSMPPPVTTERDANATLADLITCPDGYGCRANETGPWVLERTTNLQIEVDVLDAGAQQQEATLGNVATLIENDNKEVRQAQSEVTVGPDAEEPVAPAPPPPAPPPPAPPADCVPDLSVENELVTSWNRTIEYDWNLTREAFDENVSVYEGQSTQAIYWINATREAVDVTEQRSIHGNITISNSVDCPASGIMADIAVLPPEGERPLAEFQVNTSIRPELQPGESFTYPYTFALPEDDLPAEMRLIVTIGANNMTGAAATTEDTVPFDEPLDIGRDANATIEDVVALPQGFSGQVNRTGLWEVDGNVSLAVVLVISHADAPCNETYTGNNTARLIEGNGRENRTAEEEFNISVLCEGDGCTRSIGYWMNDVPELTRALDEGIWLGVPDGPGSELVDSPERAEEVIQRDGDARNGTARLKSQLLAVELNNNTTASTVVIRDDVREAHQLIGVYGNTDWEGIDASTRARINELQETFDDYNNGRLEGGPLHCPDRIDAASALMPLVR